MLPLPEKFLEFQEKYPDVTAAYSALGSAVHNSGPLDEKNRALIKLGIAVGCQSEGAVHSHVRKALDLTISKDEIRQAILLSAPTIGFPFMMAALTWAEDILNKE
jgi:alkylhydroperoxidase/carboxymuconolactone decarboxylase family protein YurZ